MKQHPLEIQILGDIQRAEIEEETQPEETPIALGISIHDILPKMQELWIYDKRAQRVRFRLNEVQEVVWYEHMWPCLEAMEPLYFILLKARQQGISTLIAAFIYVIVTWYANQRAYVIAQDKDAVTSDIFERTRIFYEESPENEQRVCLGGGPTQRGLWYAKPWRSRIKIDTCNKITLGSGGTNHWLHLSEPAKWLISNPKVMLASLMNTVPKPTTNPFTGVFWEATATSTGPCARHFKMEWKKAESGKSQLKPIFLPWQKHKEYFVMPSKNQVIEKPAEVKDYQENFKLSEGQVLFMLEEMKRTCGDDIKTFHQEYPASAALAFQETGNFWFNRSLINEMQTKAVEVNA